MPATPLWPPSLYLLFPYLVSLDYQGLGCLPSISRSAGTGWIPQALPTPPHAAQPPSTLPPFPFSFCFSFCISLSVSLSLCPSVESLASLSLSRSSLFLCPSLSRTVFLTLLLCLSLHLSVSRLSLISSFSLHLSVTFLLSMSLAPSLSLFLSVSLSLSALHFLSISVSLSVSLVNSKEVLISRTPDNLRRTPRTCHGKGCPEWQKEQDWGAHAAPPLT